MAQDKNRGGPKGPRVSLMLIPAPGGISSKEVKVIAKLSDSLKERPLRFLIQLEGIFVLPDADAIKTTVNREVEYTFKIPPNTTRIYFKVETIDETRAFAELPLLIPPESEAGLPSGKKAVKLEVVLSIHRGERFIVIVSRTNGKGEVAAGNICYLDVAASNAKNERVGLNENGVAILEFPVEQTRRKIILFLPETPGERKEVWIPGKQTGIEVAQESATTPTNPRKNDFISEIKAACQRGRERAKQEHQGEEE